MLIEDLAKEIAKNFDKESGRPHFSIQRKEAVLKQLSNTIRHVFCELSSWLIDKYTSIDIDKNDKDNIDLCIYVDTESYYHDLMLEISLFIDTLHHYSEKIDDVTNNVDKKSEILKSIIGDGEERGFPNIFE